MLIATTDRLYTSKQRWIFAKNHVILTIMTYLYFNIDRYEIYYLFVVQVFFSFWFLLRRWIFLMHLNVFFSKKNQRGDFFSRADELFAFWLLGFSNRLNRVVHYLLYIYIQILLYCYFIESIFSVFILQLILLHIFLLEIKKKIPKRVTFNTTLLKCFNAFHFD